MHTYQFTTIWRVEARIDVVWNEIDHSGLWPTCWKGVEAVVNLRAGDASGVGTIHRIAHEPGSPEPGKKNRNYSQLATPPATLSSA